MFVSNGSQVIVKTPLSLTTSSWFTGPMPTLSARAWPSAYAGIYRQQLWVYVVVNKLAAGTARLPLPVYRRDELNRPRVDDHPMAQLLRRPNPAMGAYEFWFWVSATRDVFGEAFVYKRRERGTVTALYPLHPTAMHDNEDGTWNFDNGSLVLRDIPSTDLMVFKHYHPDSYVRGLSPLEPLRLTLENEWHARAATASFWERGARPGMALVHPGRLGEEASTRLRAQFDDIAAGAGNTGRTVVLEEGLRPEPLMLTAEEAQYIETRKLNREEACAAYDVPPPAVHILDHATYSNITEQMRSVYRDSQAPRLRYFESVVERELRAVEWSGDDVYAEFLMDEVLRGDFEARQEALAGASHMTIAEKRKIENLPFIDGTDRIFLNTATMPLDAIDAMAAAQDAPPPAPADEAEEDEEIPAEAARAVMGRLSRQKSLDDVDPATIAAGLTPAQAAVVARALDAERLAGGTVSGLRARLRRKVDPR